MSSGKTEIKFSETWHRKLAFECWWGKSNIVACNSGCAAYLVTEQGQCQFPTFVFFIYGGSIDRFEQSS